MKSSLPMQIESRSAFSLVETALALGIMGFACVILVGLLSVGLNSSRENIDRNALSQIVGTMRGAVRAATSMGTSSSLESGYTERFDDFGVAVSPGNTGDVLFTARLSASSVTLPGGTTPIKSWKVTLSSPARGGQSLGSGVFWSTP